MKSAAGWVARSAAAVALLLAVQTATGALGQLATGSAVNFLLALCALAIGPGVAATAAVISPVLAFLVGVGPAMVQVIPAIALGNLAYVLLTAAIAWLWRKNVAKGQTVGNFAAVILSAACKCALLYGLIVCWIAPSFLPEKALPVLTASFGIMQFFTAAIGGALAAAVTPLVKRAVSRRT